MGNTGNGTGSGIPARCWAPWVPPLAVILPGLAYLPGSVQWLDAPEFLAAGWALGLPHPPGHPSFLLALRSVLGLPLGSIAFRGNLVSLLFGALSAALVSLLGRDAARRAGAGEGEAALGGMIGGLVFALGGSSMLQALSLEVYTASCAATLAALWVLGRSPGDVRAWTAAAVIVALGLGNHHLLVLLAFPAFFVALGPIQSWRRLRVPVIVGALMLVGVHGYLLIRGVRSAWPAWTATSSWDGILWYVSAKVFAGSLGGYEAAHATWHGNAALALGLWMDALSPPNLLVAALGAWALFRWGARRPVLVLVLLVLGNLPSKVAMGILDPSNADDHGYFLPAIAGLAALAGGGLGALLGRIRASRGPRWTGALAVTAILCPLAAWWTSGHREALAREVAGEDLREVTEAIWRDLPPRSVWMPSHYPVHFGMMASQVVEGARPDVTQVQQSLYSRARGGGWYASEVARRDRSLAPLCSAFLLEGVIRWDLVRDLAMERPVRIQASDDLSVPLQDVSFEGWSFQVLPVADSRPLDQRARDHLAMIAGLALGGPALGVETRRVILRHLATSAGWLAGQGALGAARQLLDLALTMAPRDRMLRAIRASLGG